MRPDGDEWESGARRRRRWLPAAIVAAVIAAPALTRAGGDADGGLPIEAAVEQAERPIAVENPAPAEPVEVPTSAGAWRDLAVAPLEARAGQALVWTGVCTRVARPPECGEALLWGGSGTSGPLVDGAAYEPLTDAWRTLPDAPRGRDAAIPVAWTGSDPATPWLGRFGGELVVWGASARDRAASGAGGEPRGAAYDPMTDAWRTLPDAPVAPRVGHTLTWNGSEVLAWGGWVVGAGDEPALAADGAAYDPVSDTWRRLPDAPIAPRVGHAAVAGAGGSVVVFGGRGDGAAGGRVLADGAIYDPATDRWASIAPLPPSVHTLDGLYAPALAWLPDGGRGLLYVIAAAREPAFGAPALLVYDLAEETWDVLDAEPLGLRTRAFAATLTGGRELLVWGGRRALTGGALTDGARLSAADGTWTRIPDAPLGYADAAVSTGFQLLLWGGARSGGPSDVGARFDPALPSGREPNLAPLEAGMTWEVGLRRGTWHTSRRLHMPAEGAVHVQVTSALETEAVPRLIAGAGVGARVDVTATEVECVTDDRLERCSYTFAELPGAGAWHLALTVSREDRNPDVIVEVL